MPDLGEGGADGFFSAAIDDDPGAFAGEPGGDGQADAFGGTGDEGEFIGQL